MLVSNPLHNTKPALGKPPAAPVLHVFLMAQHSPLLFPRRLQPFLPTLLALLVRLLASATTPLRAAAEAVEGEAAAEPKAAGADRAREVGALRGGDGCCTAIYCLACVAAVCMPLPCASSVF